MPAVRATPRFARAIQATAELLSKLRLESMFVAGVARSAWLGSEVDRGAIDLLALMSGPQKNQLAMMASNRGFRVEKDEIEQSEELDLVPLNFVDSEGDVRVHVLLASNALYARMFANRREAELSGTPLSVAAPEDLALMLLLADDDEGVRGLAELPQFDRVTFRERLESLGLGEAVRE
jgi:hypothetical protein